MTTSGGRKRGINWSTSTATVNDLAVSILGLAAACEGLADLVATAYICLLPDSIAAVLIRRFPLPSADLVKLIRAAVKREGYGDMTNLAAEFDRLEQVRADLAHSDMRFNRRAHPGQLQLYNHRGKAPRVLPETIALDDLRAEVDRAMQVREYMTGLAYRLGQLRVVAPPGLSNDLPEAGPGPRPVVRDADNNELA